MRSRQDWQQMREHIIGLGEDSSRRSYYPELMTRLEELEAAREDLRTSEANLRELFNSLHDAVVIHDFTGQVMEVNEAALKMFGLHREAIPRVTIADLSAAPQGSVDVSLRLRAIWEDVQRKGAHVFRWRSCRPGVPDSGFEVEVALRTLRWYGQEVLVAVVRDITERLKLEAVLQQSQKLESLGQLAGGVAHDVNNMLGVIIGYSEILMDDVPSESPLHRDLAQIRKAAMHSADLARQLLAFARRQTIQPRLLQLNDVLENTQKMLRRLVGEQHTLVWQPGENLEIVHMDPSQVDQIVTNLVINARDALPGAGTITVSTANVKVDAACVQAHPDAREGAYVVLRVKDDGCGIPPDIQAHIFDPFFTTKGVGKGTGLGLATVYGIVRQNNGFIGVDSHVGLGTAISVYLPRHEGQPEIPGEPDSQPLAGKETILLVEDELALLHLGRRVLEAAGYRVLSTPCPLEAFCLAETHASEMALLLTDLVMPKLNGWELHERIRALQPSIRTLFTSGYPAGTIKRHPQEAPGTAFLQKPFTRESILKAVRALLDEPLPGTHQP